MSIREQILQEIDCEIENQKEICADIVNTSGWRVYQKAMEKAKDIVRKYLPENDGWIPVEDRLPTKEEFINDDGRFILDDGNRRYQGLFDIYDGKFKFSKHISGINYELFDDNCAIAWQPLPAPYKPKEEKK